MSRTCRLGLTLRVLVRASRRLRNASSAIRRLPLRRWVPCHNRYWIMHLRCACSLRISACATCVLCRGNNGTVRRYHDSTGLEADIVVELRGGRYVLTEVKLGAAFVDERSASLLNLPENSIRKPWARRPSVSLSSPVGMPTGVATGCLSSLSHALPHRDMLQGSWVAPR